MAWKFRAQSLVLTLSILSFDAVPLSVGEEPTLPLLYWQRSVIPIILSETQIKT